MFLWCSKSYDKRINQEYFMTLLRKSNSAMWSFEPFNLTCFTCYTIVESSHVIFAVWGSCHFISVVFWSVYFPKLYILEWFTLTKYIHQRFTCLFGFFFLHFIYFIRLAISKVSNIKTLKPGKLAILGTRSIHCLCTIFISYLLYHWCGVENKSIKLNWFELIKNKFISVFVLWEGGDCPYLKKKMLNSERA